MPRKLQIFFLTCLVKIIKFHNFFKGQTTRGKVLSRYSESLESPFSESQEASRRIRGFIFVTPHIGNWDIPSHVSSVVGILLGRRGPALSNRPI